MENKSLDGLSNEEVRQLFPVKLTEYNREWPKRYSTEKDPLCKVIGEESIYRISHIGSTSVPGLLAKPTTYTYVTPATGTNSTSATLLIS